MYIFLDETGDTGFKFKRGSSTHFIIGYIVVDDENLSCIDEILPEIRRKNGQPLDYEFKFRKMRPKLREEVLKELIRCRFNVHAIVVPKETLVSDYLKTNREAFYHFITKLTLEHDGGTLIKAKLVVDKRKKGRIAIQQFNTYLRQMLNKERMKLTGISHRDSKTSNHLQVADICVGAIGWKYKKGDERYLNVLKKGGKIKDIWEFK